MRRGRLSPAIFELSEIRSALVAEAKALELFTLDSRGFVAHPAPTSQSRPRSVHSGEDSRANFSGH